MEQLQRTKKKKKNSILFRAMVIRGVQTIFFQVSAINLKTFCIVSIDDIGNLKIGCSTRMIGFKLNCNTTVCQ